MGRPGPQGRRASLARPRTWSVAPPRARSGSPAVAPVASLEDRAVRPCEPPPGPSVARRVVSRIAAAARLHRIPAGTWSWKGTVLVVVLVAAPQVVTLALRPETRNLPAEASLTSLVTYPVVLCATILFYFHWRIVGGTRAAWLACGLTATSVQAFSLAGTRLANPELVDRSPGLMMAVDLLFALTLLVMVTAAGRIRLVPDPIAAGTVLGLVVTAARWVLLAAPDTGTLPHGVLALWALLLVVVQLAIAVAVLNLGCAPSWVRVRAAWAVALLGVTQAVTYPAHLGSVRSIVAIAATLVGAVLLCTTTAALLRLSIRENRVAVEELHDRVEQVEAEVRADRARLHEITGTVAGIASASRLIHHRPDIPEVRKDHLQEMLDSEIGRLERLLSPEQQEVTGIDLDALVWPLVVAQQSLGHRVRWEPSGLHAWGRHDDLAEVLHILLENAARHAPGAEAVIEARRVRGTVEIVVSDTGPGLSQSDPDEVFEWGARGPGSSGQGIGLHVALRLMSEQGGYLRVSGASGSGAVFVIGLPDLGVDRGSVTAAQG